MNLRTDARAAGQESPIRILHVLGVMNRAGIETWLMHMLRAIDRQRFAMDFVVESHEPGDFDDEIRQLGSAIHCVGPRTQFGFSRRLARVIRDQAPDVLHSHHNHFNGLIMRLARREQVPMRIAHSHIDTSSRDNNSSFARKLYIRLMRDWIFRHATVRLACSVPAATGLFGSDGKARALYRVMHYSIDLSPFAKEHDRSATRKELAIPEGAWVIGQVGRMTDVKNHRLTIDSFAAVLREAPNAFLLLAGDGPLRAEHEARVQQLGINDRVRFTGNRGDVPRLLCGAMDVYVMPSKYEGLPVALLEAQAAGLPCVISTAIAEEADAIPELITRLSINEPWAETLLRLRGHQRQQRSCLARMRQTDFAIEQGVENLQQIYAKSRDRRGEADTGLIAA